MFKFVMKRILTAIPLIFMVISLNFFLIRLAPGSPFDKDAELPEETKANLKAQYGLDQPLYVQYGMFLSKAVVGDFGSSYQYRDRSVQDIIVEAFPVSAKLGATSMLIAIVIGICIGMFTAIRQNSWLDYTVVASATVGRSIPPMVLAPVFVAIFSLTLHWLPVAGWGELKHYVGPVVCLALYDITSISRLSRGAMLEVLRTKHLITARAKGLSERRVLFVHALREAMLPLVTYLGPAFAGILTGTVVVESVFNVPGMGRFLVSAAVNRDYTVVLGIALLACLLLIVANTLVDILLGVLDPRIRLS